MLQGELIGFDRKENHEVPADFYLKMHPFAERVNFFQVGQTTEFLSFFMKILSFLEKKLKKGKEKEFENTMNLAKNWLLLIKLTCIS